MKKVVVWFLAAALGMSLGVWAVASKRQVSPDNPFANRYLSVQELVTYLRGIVNPRLIEISNRNPLDLRYIHILYLLGYPKQALVELWEVSQTRAPTTLEELIKIPYLGSPSKLPRLLLIFRFPDESMVLQNLRIERPDWWDWVTP
jgi:hypothetical protein